MVHLHAVVRADYFPQAQLSRYAVKGGWGKIAWISDGDHLCGAYSAKCAGYSSKGVHLYPEWLSLNGTRPWHWSRDYTHGTPMRDWVRACAPPADKGPWRIVPASEVVAMEERRRHVAAVAEAAGEADYPRLRAARERLVGEITAVDTVQDRLGGRVVDREELERMYPYWELPESEA